MNAPPPPPSPLPLFLCSVIWTFLLNWILRASWVRQLSLMTTRCAKRACPAGGNRALCSHSYQGQRPPPWAQAPQKKTEERLKMRPNVDVNEQQQQQQQQQQNRTGWDIQSQNSTASACSLHTQKKLLFLLDTLNVMLHLFLNVTVFMNVLSLIWVSESAGAGLRAQESSSRKTSHQWTDRLTYRGLL